MTAFWEQIASPCTTWPWGPCSSFFTKTGFIFQWFKFWNQWTFGTKLNTFLFVGDHLCTTVGDHDYSRCFWCHPEVLGRTYFAFSNLNKNNTNRVLTFTERKLFILLWNFAHHWPFCCCLSASLCQKKNNNLNVKSNKSSWNRLLSVRFREPSLHLCACFFHWPNTLMVWHGSRFVTGWTKQVQWKMRYRALVVQISYSPAIRKRAAVFTKPFFFFIFKTSNWPATQQMRLFVVVEPKNKFTKSGQGLFVQFLTAHWLCRKYRSSQSTHLPVTPVDMQVPRVSVCPNLQRTSAFERTTLPKQHVCFARVPVFIQKFSLRSEKQNLCLDVESAYR